MEFATATKASLALIAQSALAHLIALATDSATIFTAIAHVISGTWALVARIAFV